MFACTFHVPCKRRIGVIFYRRIRVERRGPQCDTRGVHQVIDVGAAQHRSYSPMMLVISIVEIANEAIVRGLGDVLVANVHGLFGCTMPMFGSLISRATIR